MSVHAVLLGIEIAASLVAFLGGLLLVIRGFQGFGNATERVLDGHKRAWISIALWTVVGVGGGWISALTIGYWLTQ